MNILRQPQSVEGSMQLNHSGSCNKNNEFRVTDQVNEWKFSAATYIPWERGVHFYQRATIVSVGPFCGPHL